MPSSQELNARLWRHWDETPRASEPGAMPPSSRNTLFVSSLQSVAGCKDTSEVPKDFFEKLARLLFRMCHRDPDQNAICLTATATQAQATNVLVGDNWTEYPGYKHIGTLMETVMSQQELYPERVIDVYRDDQPRAPIRLGKKANLSPDRGVHRFRRTVEEAKPVQWREWDKKVQVLLPKDTTLTKEQFLKDNQKWLDDLGNPDVDRWALEKSIDRTVTEEMARSYSCSV
ncbi:hypothetical protein NW762_000072 [Fusarium torreyae]|uniref:Uncharacterized protein n=1 Tax=Fusarium torreyae TaxID=1237075 RepID=A0A9W8VQ00_9HYPO|nr:hypothetical protein NW762_000072 [Fusarium torreyae]